MPFKLNKSISRLIRVTFSLNIIFPSSPFSLMRALVSQQEMFNKDLSLFFVLLSCLSFPNLLLCFWFCYCVFGFAVNFQICCVFGCVVFVLCVLICCCILGSVMCFAHTGHCTIVLSLIFSLLVTVHGFLFVLIQIK